MDENHGRIKGCRQILHGKSWCHSYIIPPLDNEGNKTCDCDVIAIFLKLNVLFYIHIRSRDDYTDAWAMEQVLSYSERHEDGFNDGI